jgi:hypothetical protein
MWKTSMSPMRRTMSPRVEADTTHVASVHEAKVDDTGTTVADVDAAGPDARNLADVVDAADVASMSPTRPRLRATI